MPPSCAIALTKSFLVGTVNDIVPYHPVMAPPSAGRSKKAQKAPSRQPTAFPLNPELTTPTTVDAPSTEKKWGDTTPARTHTQREDETTSLSLILLVLLKNGTRWIPPCLQKKVVRTRLCSSSSWIGHVRHSRDVPFADKRSSLWSQINETVIDLFIGAATSHHYPTIRWCW